MLYGADSQGFSKQSWVERKEKLESNRFERFSRRRKGNVVPTAVIGMDVTSAGDLNCSQIRTNPSNIISSSTSSPLLDPSSRQTAVITSNKKNNNNSSSSNRNRKCHPYSGNNSRNKGKGSNGGKKGRSGNGNNNLNLNLSEVTAKELLAAASLILNQKQSQSTALSRLLSTMNNKTSSSDSNLVCSGSSHVHPTSFDGDCRCLPLTKGQGIIHSVPVVCMFFHSHDERRVERVGKKLCLLWSVEWSSILVWKDREQNGGEGNSDPHLEQHLWCEDCQSRGEKRRERKIGK